jgi:predicted anti-sigma-YlaC factor YlaD
MACTEHKERLIEAALDPEPDAVHEMRFVRHVETCEECRAELDRQRALYEQIDDGVAALVGVQAPGAIAARVRQDIAAQKASFTVRSFGWLSAAAVAAIAIAFAIAVRVPHRTPTTDNTIAANAASPVATPAANGTHSVGTQPATSGAPHAAA